MNQVSSRDGTRISFTRAGSGPALIFIDPAGSFGGFRALDPLPAVLSSSFSVITYDRRGRGQSSDTLPYSVEREVEDLEALIGAVGGAPFVFGFSSGATLALEAARRGVPMKRIALMEPPARFEDDPEEDGELDGEIARLAAAGRRGEAVECFHRGIGVPPELTAGMRHAPFWPALESLAHTLAYDVELTRTIRLERRASIATPTLVVASESSDPRLLDWARAVAESLPNATLRTLKGSWHGIPADVLAPVLTEFLTGQK
jgi:pimeloyl-ACP methyl ester carboxylesterase